MTTHPPHSPADAVSAARDLDHRLVAARRDARRASHQLAVLLTEMAGGGFRTLGYASILQYATMVLELPARQARDLIRIGRAIPTLPVLGSALAGGLLDWTKAREIIRVATADTEQGWVERAQIVSARVIEQEVACSVRGDTAPVGAPTTEKAPLRRRVCFEMETSDAEVLYQALILLRVQSDLDPSEIEDGALLAAMARTIVRMEESSLASEVEWTDGADGVSDEDEFTQDAASQRAGADEGEFTHGASGSLHGVADACELMHGAGGSSREGTDAGERTQGERTQGEGSPGRMSDPRGSCRLGERYRIVLQLCPNCHHMDAPDADVSDTIAVEACCDAEIIDMRPGPTEGHATRTIRPALRRRVFHRAGYTCEVPGCRNKLWLDVHHTDPWAMSHSHAFNKLMVTCEAHHRAIHEGGLAVEVGKDQCICVQHADGRRYVGRPGRGRGTG